MTLRTTLLAAILGSLVMVLAGGCAELDLGDGSDSLVLKDPNYDPNAVDFLELTRESRIQVETDPHGGADAAFRGTVLWAKGFGGSRADISRDIALGRFGEVAITGTISDSVDFGSGPSEATGAAQAFVAMYNTHGRHIWSDCTSGTGDHHGRAVAIDSDGNVYIAGEFAGRMVIGGRAIDSRGRTDAFVTKYSVNGGVLWTRVFGGDSDETVRAMAIDASGHVVVAGTFFDALETGEFALTGSGGSDVFVAEIASNGQVLGARSIGGPTDDAVGALAVNDTGYHAVAVTYVNPETGKRNAAIAMLHRSYSQTWIRQLTGIGDDEVNALVFDSKDTLYAVGSYTESMVARDVEFPQAMNRDAFAWVLTAEGDTLWNQRLGSTGNDTATSVALDALHGLIITGTLTEPSQGSTDLFVVATTFNGRGEWGRVFGGTGRDSVTAAVSDLDGHVILTGGFERAVRFDDDKLESAGEGDLYLLSIVQ